MIQLQGITIEKLDNIHNLIISKQNTEKRDKTNDVHIINNNENDLLENSFHLAGSFSKNQNKKSLLKVLAGHGVIGSFFGANGYRVQAVQQNYEVNISVTTKRVHYPGSNNKGILLFQGKLTNILQALRPLYKAIQEENNKITYR